MQRAEQGLPALTAGIPVLLEVDPSLDLDKLRQFFDFEIVSEVVEGFVIVASQDLDLSLFLQRVNEFATEIRGSGTVASIHRLSDDPDQIERLHCILSERLFQQWPAMQDDQVILSTLASHASEMLERFLHGPSGESAIRTAIGLKRSRDGPPTALKRTRLGMTSSQRARRKSSELSLPAIGAKS